MAKATPYFSEDTFKFLRQLAKNNTREWFLANKPRYEASVRGPCLRLITDLADPLKDISPQLTAIAKPVGGSLFRIHRDTRFAGDKSPYKTNAGMYFSHAAATKAARNDAGGGAPGRLDAPGLYLQVQPGHCFLGGGIWHPQPETTKRIRDYMISNPASWKKATRDPKFRKQFEPGGESLVRPPKGYDPAHELIEDLKRKDFIASAQLDDEMLLRPDLVKQLMARYTLMAPMLDWLCGSLDLDF
ncbi:uncharacterized protein (TIGR02453 family) [Panacagrimonas perspica]|uniref:Uncharacterized protein (TIGR02453 family) n=1 Tax=Panacagrimonas perspica TaxID=381431 RepID=A0A4R7P4E6_9GAMM|nr:DUF2461 domain-containing protein [Panacagrimonas perspica]TDU28644.1 uncharacterized protein (TIGR02453 family) [Panacagrimonas perspica]THD04973.1 hypothetical protein B1810_03235 [Panacagrimonas perspica]